MSTKEWFNKNAIRIKNMNLRKKILLLYLFVVLIPVIIFGLIANSIIFNFLKKDYSISANEAIDQVVKNVEFRKSTYEQLVTNTAYDGEVVARLSQTYDDYYAQWDTVNYLDRTLLSSAREILPGVQTLRIYHSNDTLVEDGGILWKPKGRLLAGQDESSWYDSMLSSKSSMVWDLARGENNSTTDLTLSCKIRGFTTGESVGVVFLSVWSEKVFQKVIQDAFNDTGDVFLLNDKDTIFCSSREGYAGKSIAQTPLKNISLNEKNIDEVIEFEGNKVIILSKKVTSGWRVVGAIPVQILEERAKALSTWIIVITLSLVILSAILMLIVINNVVFRLRGLEHKMAEVTIGKFGVSVIDRYADELGDLEQGFNYMSTRLKELTNEIACTRSREREEALNALQSQINPHFLYNTLGIIRWRALDVGDDELCHLVDAMTVFYRLALNKGKTVLKIQDEIEHVKAYIEIQQFRYKNSVNIKWDIDPSILELYTIKLILQPIIENCYMHGMLAKRGSGILTISAGHNDEGVYFEIRDNGIGIAENDVQKILYGNNKVKTHGYGLINIQERLKLYFSEKGKLIIDSNWGKGTVVTIKIPVCIDPPKLKELNSDA